METIPGVTMQGNEALVSVFIEMSTLPAALEDYGVKILSGAGGIYVARLPVANLEAVASLPGVLRLEADARVEPFLNLSVPDIRADLVWHEGKYGNLQGRGVVVGAVDTGVNLDHLNFKEEGGSGLSRIVWVWDQGDATGPGPSETCRDYTRDPPGELGDCGGTECSPRDEACDEVDEEGHGTGVTGVLAGNGQADCPSGTDVPCSGVAPKGEIIVVKLGEGLASEVIQGVDYIFQKAEAMGKPAVVNLSVGWYPGSRDGNSLLERNLSSLIGPGRIIVAAAGNNHLEMGHARMELNPQSRTLYLGCIPLPSDVVKVYGWYDPPSAGSIEVRVWYYTYVNEGTAWIPYIENADPVDQDSPYGEIIVQHGEASGDARGFTITLESGASLLRSGEWHIEVRNPGAGALGTSVDLWVDRTYDVGNAQCPQRVPARFTKADQERETTVAPPCTADDVICVGSYNTRCVAGSTNYCTRCSVDYPATANCIEGPETNGDISSFSSLGPTRDGRNQPWISAPGNMILTPFIGGGNPYAYWGGTSFAAPHVAGTVALMLEANPTLTPQNIMNALRTSARKPEGVSDWDEAWGYGKVDAFGAVEQVASEIPPPPPPVPHGLGEGDDVCFIATAVFGGIDSPQVERLREVRDHYLLKTSLGRRFVRFYYRWSPPVAAWLKERPMPSRVVRLSLMPLVGVAQVTRQGNGPASAVLACFGLFLISAVCYSSLKRRIR
jgi:subtilisin family serine protease